MQKMADVGFVGCGTHATNNLYPMLKYARCRLRAVCDLNQGLAERNARMFGAASVFTSVDKMLAQEALDGVFVVGPPEAHAAVGRKAAERGIPVFVEKPPAPSLSEAMELIKTARANNTFVMTGFMKRFALAYRRIHSLAERREFEPSSGFFRYTHWPSRNLRGMMLGMSIHPIDLAISFLGDVAEVSSHVYEAHGAISLALTLRFENGKWAQLMLGCHGPRIQEQVEITGVLNQKHCCFRVDNIQHCELHTAGLDGIDVLAPEMCQIEPRFDFDDIKLWRPDYGIPNMGQNSPFFAGYAGEVREFVDAILEKREPSPNSEEALKSLQVIEAVLSNPNKAVGIGHL